MKEKQKIISEILKLIAEELNISKTMQETAVRSYTSVGTWLGEGIDFDVEIMPQGSINLGTVIRPLSDSDDGYDMDLVCLLKDGQMLLAERIKEIIGCRLYEHEEYREKLEEEGKRCWTMSYAGFHIDILPCVPRTVFHKPESTEIRLTHKNEENLYEDRYSNPYKYHIWFEEQMKESLAVVKSKFSIENRVEIDKVPTYKVRTPLQQAIQLLKRHRDVFFENDDTDAPISIIITTLAANAYNGESDLYEALCKIARDMPNYIEKRNGEYWIVNPVMEEENFADKWNINPNKSESFYRWIEAVRKDLIEGPVDCFGLDVIGERYIKALGEAPVKRALNRFAEKYKDARAKGDLFISGLQGGLNIGGTTGTPVREHTFYGE